MILSTTYSVPGHAVTANHGLVRGNTIRARHLGRDIVAGLRSIVGGEITDYTKMLAEAREQALDRMIEEARAVGAIPGWTVMQPNHRRIRVSARTPRCGMWAQRMRHSTQIASLLTRLRPTPPCPMMPRRS